MNSPRLILRLPLSIATLCWTALSCVTLCCGLGSTASAAGLPIKIRLEKPGKVSLAVYDATGRMVRRLHVGDDLPAGEHTVVWDGLDDHGRPAKPGRYQWRMAASPGIKSQFVTQLGISDGYWHWPGAHEGPGTVEVIGDTVVIAAHLVEGSSQYIAWDLKTGKVKWRQKPASGFGWINCIAADDQHLYASGFSLGQGEPELLLLDPKSGDYISSWSTWKRALWTYVPVAKFAAHAVTDDTDLRQSKLDAAVYSEQRGHGWIKSEGIKALQIGGDPTIGSTTARSATFRADLPEGHSTYRTTVHLSNPTDEPRTIDVRISGRRGDHSVTLEPGETKKLENRRGKGPVTVEISNPEGKPVGWAVRNVTVRAVIGQIAAHGDKLVGLLADNSVVWINPLGGKQLGKKPFTVRHATEIERRVWLQLDSMARDIEILPDGRVVVLREDELVEVQKDGSTRALISGLTEAACVAADAKTGGLFIAEHGESQQVKAFNADFKLLGTFGRKGGRQQGRYVPTDFYKVEDIAGDGRGGFVIVEQHSGPRRTARFDKDGMLVREWYGAQTFFVNSWEDPKKPNHIWFDNGHGWVTEAEVDFNSGNWKPYATYRLGGSETQAHDKNAFRVEVQHTGYKGFHVRYHNGQKFLCKIRDPLVLRVEEENRRVVPVAAYHAFAHNQYTITEKKIPTWALTYQEAKKHKYIGVMWSDLNGDGRPQKDECRPSKQNFGAGDCWVGDDLTYYTAGGNGGHTIRPTWKNGVPVYPLPAEAIRHNARANWRDAEGSYYAQHCRGHLKVHGFGWPSTMVAQNVGLRKWSADGKTLLFDVGNKAVTWPGKHPEGQLHFPVKLAGIAKGCVGVTERVGMPLKFWTTDGLYVGHLFNRRGQGPEIAYHWWRVDPRKGDSFGPQGNQALFQYDTAAGGRLVETKDGEVYFCGAGWNSVPVYRLSGFDEIERAAGEIALNDEARPASATGRGLTAEYRSLDGSKTARRLEAGVTLGSFGNYRKMNKDAKIAWPAEVAGGKFKVKLTGQLEPKLSDTYYLFVYGGPADVYVDGKQVLSTESSAAFKSGPRFRSQPIELQAGKKVSLRIHATRAANQALYLAWESNAVGAEIVPAEYLYAGE